MTNVIRRAGREAEGTNLCAEDRTPLSEPPLWSDCLLVPHHLEDAINEAAEDADREPGGDFAFRARIWAVHDEHEASEVELVTQRDTIFARETEAICEGVSRVRAA